MDSLGIVQLTRYKGARFYVEVPKISFLLKKENVVDSDATAILEIERKGENRTAY
jgi:hypothetical protein